MYIPLGSEMKVKKPRSFNFLTPQRESTRGEFNAFQLPTKAAAIKKNLGKI